MCRYGAGKVSSGANVDGAPLPEDAEENGKEEEVGEFGFHTLVGLCSIMSASNPYELCLPSLYCSLSCPACASNNASVSLLNAAAAAGTSRRIHTTVIPTEHMVKTRFYVDRMKLQLD